MNQMISSFAYMQLVKFSRKERNLCKRISDIRNPWLNKPEHVQPKKHKPKLCFVHPIFGFWSLLATKLRKYENIT